MSYLFGGLDNTGKSEACMRWIVESQTKAKPGIYLDLEAPRAENLRKERYATHDINIRSCKVIIQKSDANHRRGERDPVASYKLFDKELNGVLDSFEKYSVVVVDGISDIRSDYAELWLTEYNLKHPDKKRKVIGKDPGAWGVINRQVYDKTIQPLQELSDLTGTTVLFTAKMKDDYKLVKDWEGKEDTQKTGIKLIDVDQDMRHNLSTICQMTADDKGKYYIAVQKSKKGIFTKVEITGKSVYEYLIMDKEL